MAYVAHPLPAVLLYVNIVCLGIHPLHQAVCVCVEWRCLCSACLCLQRAVVALRKPMKYLSVSQVAKDQLLFVLKRSHYKSSLVARCLRSINTVALTLRPDISERKL